MPNIIESGNEISNFFSHGFSHQGKVEFKLFEVPMCGVLYSFSPTLRPLQDNRSLVLWKEKVELSSVDLPFLITIRGINLGKERKELTDKQLHGSGDFVGFEVFRVPKLYTLIVLHAIDCLSPTDKAAGLNVWGKLIERYRKIFDEVAEEFGIKGIPWEIPDVAGACLAAEFFKSEYCDVWRDNVGRILNSGFGEFSSSNLSVDSLIRIFQNMIEREILGALYYFRSRWFTEIVNKILERKALNRDLFYWFLNGIPAAVCVLFPEIRRKDGKQLPIIWGYFQSAADISCYGFSEKSERYFHFNTAFSDNNWFIDRLLGELKPHVSSHEYYLLLIEKAKKGGYAVLHPNAFPFTENLEALFTAKSASMTGFFPPSSLDFIAICTDGVRYDTRNFERKSSSTGPPPFIEKLAYGNYDDKILDRFSLTDDAAAVVLCFAPLTTGVK